MIHLPSSFLNELPNTMTRSQGGLFYTHYPRNCLKTLYKYGMNNDNPDQSLKDKNTKTAIKVFAVVFLMVALAYASVPLYSIFCRVTGWGGTTQVAQALPAPEDIVDRNITVRFDANTARDLFWDFKPEKISVTVKLGEKGFINFIAKNRSNVPIGGTAVFNVTPLKAGKYFQKIQCFCFDEQILQPGEQVNMPVLFYVDPALSNNENLEEVKTITLSYTFFKSDSENLEKAMEEFYDQE